MSITFIIFVALVVILSGYSKRKQALASQFAPEPDADESDATFEQFAAEEETVDDKSSYYSYEAEPAPDPAPAYRPAARRQEAVEVRPILQDEPAPMRFDLRQAVISQVILNNPYNSEINQ